MYEELGAKPMVQTILVSCIIMRIRSVFAHLNSVLWGGVLGCATSSMVTFPVFYLYPIYLSSPNTAFITHTHTHTPLNYPAFFGDFMFS